MKYVVCYSGGHSSALVAIEAVRKAGKDNVILLNHNISPLVEHEDIKRFKQEIADYLGVPITYSNMPGWENKTPLDVCVEIGAFKVGNGTALCTNRLKTEPFRIWLNKNYPSNVKNPRKDITVLYGFDEHETKRIQRRIGVLATMGYFTDFPLARWERTIKTIEEIGIDRPVTYKTWKHANCIGCLKAGKKHWYSVYCFRPDIFRSALDAEDAIGYSIIKDNYLKDLIPKFQAMRMAGIIPSDTMKFQTFWAKVRKELNETETDNLPCECSE